MSLDLAFWSGERPKSDALAAQEFVRRVAYMEDNTAELEPPSPGIEGFLAEILARYPALGEPGDDQSPWVTGPEPGDINGDFAYLTMSFSASDATIDFIIDASRRHGLVCYDPQSEALA